MLERKTATREDRLAVVARHLARLEAVLERAIQADQRFVWLRLGALLGGGAVSYLAFAIFGNQVGFAVVGLAVIFFLFVIRSHRQLDRLQQRLVAARRLAQVQQARLLLDWPAIPLPPAYPMEETELHAHPFATDVQIVGSRSLLHLVDTALSPGGSARLRQWLLVPQPDPALISDRQMILREIQPLVAFRSRLALQGALLSRKGSETLDGDQLLLWLEPQADLPHLKRTLLLLGGMAVFNASLFILFNLGYLPAYWIGSFTVYALVYVLQFGALRQLFSMAQNLSVSLERFRSLLLYLERYRYQPGSRLAQAARIFWEGRQRPSHYLRRAASIASGASLQNNLILWLALNAVMPWDLFFAYLLERSKAELLRRMPAWLDAWYELEALNSLANYAYLHPETSYPHILPLDAADEPVLSARGLGHPLIPAEQRVSNDFTIESLGELVIVTGSNMSGKSTFLRTLGINLALVNAGTAVCAQSLHILPFRLFTSIQVSDSLSDGISYFYAEVRRLKALLDALENGQRSPYPLFFLIDEIFRGTNNRERAIGSHAYLSALVGGYGTGAISTHDIELVRLEHELPGVSNYHFREEVHGRQMVFDYKLHPGPCPTTNALKIMELAGLPVGHE
jgi:hypothetical protein